MDVVENRERDILSVRQLHSRIDGLIQADAGLHRIYVSGEVSQVKYWNRGSFGNIYLTLKDNDEIISCIVKNYMKKRLPFVIEEAQQLVVFGSIAYETKKGSCVLEIFSFELAGRGAAYEQYLEVRNRLQEMGMFDAQYKKTIPKFVRTIGVVTSAVGAVRHDIEQTVKRRNPGIQVVLCPSMVQGANAVQTIISGIHRLEAYGVDVIIVGRGGGSNDDLWCYNDENLARTVFDCEIPIVSAVGHTENQPILDLVADLAVETPTAAAVACAWELDVALEDTSRLADSITRKTIDKLSRAQARCEVLENRIKRLSPEHQLELKRIAADNWLKKYQKAIDARLAHAKNRIAAIDTTYMADKVRRRVLLGRNRLKGIDEQIMLGKVDSRLAAAKARFAKNVAVLEGASPLKKLAAGYSLVTDEDGKVPKFDTVEIGDKLTMHMLEGEIITSVEEKMTRDI